MSWQEVHRNFQHKLTLTTIDNGSHEFATEEVTENEEENEGEELEFTDVTANLSETENVDEDDCHLLTPPMMCLLYSQSRCN